jgi:hypothetical protein
VAVQKFAGELRAFGLRQVVGDAYAGQTFRQDFQENGIQYIVSDKPKWQLYEEFEPKLHAGEVEFLDHPKLQEQLLTLIVKPSGKIDHQNGDHDDWANAATAAIALCHDSKAWVMKINPDVVREMERNRQVRSYCQQLGIDMPLGMKTFIAGRL